MNNDGSAGPFQPNPGYRPHDPATPTDPVDALLRLLPGDQSLVPELVPRICDSVVEIGCDDHDRLLIGTAPDGVPCVIVATAERQKAGLNVTRWWPIQGKRLPNVVPAGIDILLNPGGSAPLRLVASALKSSE